MDFALRLKKEVFETKIADIDASFLCDNLNYTNWKFLYETTLAFWTTLDSDYRQAEFTIKQLDDWTEAAVDSWVDLLMERDDLEELWIRTKIRMEEKIRIKQIIRTSSTLQTVYPELGVGPSPQPECCLLEIELKLKTTPYDVHLKWNDLADCLPVSGHEHQELDPVKKIHTPSDLIEEKAAQVRKKFLVDSVTPAVHNEAVEEDDFVFGKSYVMIQSNDIDLCQLQLTHRVAVRKRKPYANSAMHPRSLDSRYTTTWRTAQLMQVLSKYADEDWLDRKVSARNRHVYTEHQNEQIDSDGEAYDSDDDDCDLDDVSGYDVEPAGPEDSRSAPND